MALALLGVAVAAAVGAEAADDAVAAAVGAADELLVVDAVDVA